MKTNLRCWLPDQCCHGYSVSVCVFLRMSENRSLLHSKQSIVKLWRVNNSFILISEWRQIWGVDCQINVVMVIQFQFVCSWVRIEVWRCQNGTVRNTHMTQIWVFCTVPCFYSHPRTHKLKLNNHDNIDLAVNTSNLSSFTD